MTAEGSQRFDPALPCRFVAGRYRRSAGAKRAVIDPATLAVAGWTAETTPAEVEAALDTAIAAQRDWAALDAKSRASVLHALADRLAAADHRRTAELMTRETGKPYPEALGELANCASVFRYYAEMARDEAGKVAGSTPPGSFQYARYEPLGISVHILPFNFPVLLLCWTVAASLAAGNACIVKPAEAATLSTLDVMRCFADLPDGLIACLPGGPELGRALVASERTHAVAFTGSVAVAREVAAAAGAALKPAVIEAGGSDALIVLADAPVDIAAAGAVTAAFHLSGQVCTAAERLFVEDAVYDAFMAAFVERTERLRIGNGLEQSEIGPLVSEAARARVMRLVTDALGQGRGSSPAGGCHPGSRRAGSTRLPSSATAGPRWRSCRRSASGRWPPCRGSAASRRRSSGPMPPASASVPRSSRPAWPRPCRPPSGWRPVSSGSTTR